MTMALEPSDSENPFDSMTTEELAHHIRNERFSCRSLFRVFQLAKAVRRAARLSIDPSYPDDLIEFDDELDIACKHLARVVHLLVTIRERVDIEKINEERSRRSHAFAKVNGRRNAYKAAKPRRFPNGHSGKTETDKIRSALGQLDPEAIRALLEELQG